jgi:hypothetical protein
MAGEYFSISREVELSTLKYLEDSLEAAWTGLSVTKSFTQAYKATLPVVAINLQEVYTDRRELGATTLENEYLIMINIFATSDGQRIDLADFIMNKLKDSWVFYTIVHQSGASETLTYTNSNKRIWVHQFVSNSKIDFGEDVDKYDRFRHLISINVKTGYYA